MQLKKDSYRKRFVYFSVLFILLMIIAQCWFVMKLTDLPRGSDQFWYVVDAESWASNEVTTNNVFPNSRPIGSIDLRPYVQNRPIVYFAGSLIKLGFNSVQAFKVINLISYLTVLLILFFSLRRLKLGILVSLVAVSAYIASPLIIFSVYNPLTSMFDALVFLIFSVSTGIFYNERYNISKILFGLIFSSLSYFILINERHDFMIFALVGTLIWTFFALRDNVVSKSQIVVGWTVILSTQFYIYFNSFFPNHLGGNVPSFSLLLTDVIDYQNNMVAYFGSNSDFSDLGWGYIIWLKIRAFLRALTGLFNLIGLFYILIIFSPMLRSGFSLRNLKKIELIVMILNCLMLGVLFVYQFQYRYVIFLIAPAIFIFINTLKGAFLKFVEEKFILFIFASFLLFISFNILTFRKLSNDIVSNGRLLIQVELLKIPAETKAAVVYDGGNSFVWSWLLSDINEIHYFLPSEILNLNKHNFDLIINSESSVGLIQEQNDSIKLINVGGFMLTFVN